MPIEKSGPNKPSLVKGHRIGTSKFQTAFRKRSEQEAQEPNASLMPNRIAMMLDLSGSMSSMADKNKTKLDYLREAVEGFANTVNYHDTSIAIESFPKSVEFSMAPTNEQLSLLLFAAKIDHTLGDTPIGKTMGYVLGGISITRGIIVSDGQQTDGDLCFDVAKNFAEAEIPIDCVHIGNDEDGEATLKRIAEMTGGLYIKFDNVANFGKNFKYLTPAFRGYLSAGDAAQLLGAKEVK